jgi:hypothetical protein
VQFTRFAVPTLALGAAATALAGVVRVERRPQTAPAPVSSGAVAVARFAPVPVEQLAFVGLVASGPAALAGTWRSSRRAAEIARQNQRILLEIGEL